MAVDRRGNHAYADLAKALKRKGQRESLPCWICGHPIDYTLDYRHPMSYTYDHVVPLARGGTMRGEGRPCHRSCNSRRGAGRDITNVPRPETTREW